MCMEDIRIMRKTTKRTVAQTVNGVKNGFVPFNAHRVALIISSSQAGNISVSTEAITSLADGICVPQFTKALQISLQEHGAIVMGPLNAFSDFNTTFTYTEAVLDQD